MADEQPSFAHEVDLHPISGVCNICAHDQDHPWHNDSELERGDVYYPDVEVQLTGTDGNTGALMGKISLELKRYGVSPAYVTRFRTECLSGDYDHALATMMKWVDVA